MKAIMKTKCSNITIIKSITHHSSFSLNGINQAQKNESDFYVISPIEASKALL